MSHSRSRKLLSERLSVPNLWGASAFITSTTSVKGLYGSLTTTLPSFSTPAVALEASTEKGSWTLVASFCAEVPQSKETSRTSPSTRSTLHMLKSNCLLTAPLVGIFTTTHSQGFPSKSMVCTSFSNSMLWDDSWLAACIEDGDVVIFLCCMVFACVFTVGFLFVVMRGNDAVLSSSLTLSSSPISSMMGFPELQSSSLMFWVCTSWPLYFIRGSLYFSSRIK
mmetsp:Transcript_3710/g.10612  ORF Transcript_3710/g.10612 Transcript_3710/m.10612 type:complete len:223 (-) Transcript_3710:688-1356(-)